MADHFVDSTTGSNGDSGHTMDLAWATLEYALESGALVAGDIVWVRRIHVEYSGDPTSDIAPAYDGTPENLIKIIGWPRSTHAITSSDWTHGSTAVAVDDANMDREKHCGRYITAPDGKTYLITKVTDASNIVIDREYVGSTASNAAATIQADEDYATAQAIDDSAWTIKKAAYNADADDLPCIDFKNTAYELMVSGDLFHHFANLELRDSADTSGLIYLTGANRGTSFEGCLFYTDQNTYLIYASDTCSVAFNRCIFVGSSSGGSQRLLRIARSSDTVMRNCAVYSAGEYALLTESPIFAENVNIGVEGANASYSLCIQYAGRLTGRDLKLDGTNGTLNWVQVSPFSECSIENYGRALGAHKKFTPQGEVTKLDVVAGSGDPYKRTGGSASVVEILFNLSNTTNNLPSPVNPYVPDVFAHEFEATTASKSYRYYVQAVGAVTAAQLWIECEYVSQYEDTSEYTITKVLSDEAIAARSDASDWSQYVEVTGIAPGVASKVRIRLKCRYYHATSKIYVDPKVVIS